MRNRESNFDFLRAFAALFVIYIHVDFDSSNFSDLDLYIKSLLRWCVPIFFLMSGYFLKAPSISGAITWSKISKILKITLAANFLYIPLHLLSGNSFNLPKILMSGIWFHLWFMSSLLFGLIVLKLVSIHIKNFKLLAILSFAILFSLHVVDFLVSYENKGTTQLLTTLRFFQSAPLIWIGYIFRKLDINIGTYKSILLLLIGIFLCISEAVFLNVVGAGKINPQYPVGTLPMTLALYGLFKTLSMRKYEWFANIGRVYSLPIYLLHPIILSSLGIVCGYLKLSNNLTLGISLLLGPLISVLTTVAMLYLTPWLFSFITGNWSFSYIIDKKQKN